MFEAAPVHRETMDLETFFHLLGLNRTTGYKLARRDELPVPTIKVGRRYLVSRRAVEDLLNRRKPAENAGGDLTV